MVKAYIITLTNPCNEGPEKPHIIWGNVGFPMVHINFSYYGTYEHIISVDQYRPDLTACLVNKNFFANTLIFSYQIYCPVNLNLVLWKTRLSYWTCLSRNGR